MGEERKKWTTEHLPEGYPSKCPKKILREVIQDLYDELITKTKNGKCNPFWESIIHASLQSGNNELQYRNNSLTLLIALIGIIISLIALFLPSNKTQTKTLEDQASIQQQTLDVVKNNTQNE